MTFFLSPLRSRLKAVGRIGQRSRSKNGVASLAYLG